MALLMTSFTKSITHQNQDPATANWKHCELTLPKAWCEANGFNDDSTIIYFTSAALKANAASQPQEMAMKFRGVPGNKGSFSIRYGWKEFCQRHNIVGVNDTGAPYELRFTPDPDPARNFHGATRLLVERVGPGGVGVVPF